MNRLDAMLVVASGEETAKLLAYDDEMMVHRFAAWVGAVWYHGLPLRAEPRAYWGPWWNIRCMLGALGAMPFGCLLAGASSRSPWKWCNFKSLFSNAEPSS